MALCPRIDTAYNLINRFLVLSGMRRRIVIVEKEKCNPVGCGGHLCARVSPSNKMGKEAFVVDTDGKIRVNEEVVTDADSIAVNKCPFGALKMVRLPEELSKDPIHRYGENGFALYNLPIPLFGKVVGIIGRNGIGKSTALKILSGQIKPNLGTEEEQNKEAIIEYFKGTEAQAFFERLHAGKIVVASKPQMVEQIPKAFKGKVGELLEKTNEHDDKKLEEVTSVLELTHLLDRELDVISGGELQRVAIAATILKKANVYFFDEPTSYLDIKQRIKVSKYIGSLANEDTAVMVVEHDMIILDYMTDLTHILYGQENAYGIVSQPKSTKAGINTYLSGYLREENMRFRDKPIKFEPHAPVEEYADDQLCDWPEIIKELGTFTLKADAGVIDKHDIIGILGENGIGKTTFVKELAAIEGETKTGELSVVVKPQYIEATDEHVGTFLMGALQYKNQLVIPLDLEPLFDRTLKELSGGQLQRVVIAKTLAEDADLFLLDEPSAYLDVEQRLLMSKIIREMMELKGKACLVVDHDLLFLDYLSRKLIVFDGQPGVSGLATGPFNMADGMNNFLEDLGVTFRRDEENHRPRANKEGSQKDQEQKSSGKLYYSS